MDVSRHGVWPAITRRLGTAPAERGCGDSVDCPDVFETDAGDFAIIGQDATGMVVLPPDAGFSTTERLVLIPRDVLLSAFEHFSRGV